VPLLNLLVPARPAASRIVRQCPVCDHVLLGRGSYCPECGSEVWPWEKPTCRCRLCWSRMPAERAARCTVCWWVLCRATALLPACPGSPGLSHRHDPHLCASEEWKANIRILPIANPVPPK